MGRLKTKVEKDRERECRRALGGIADGALSQLTDFVVDHAGVGHHISIHRESDGGHVLFRCEDCDSGLQKLESFVSEVKLDVASRQAESFH